MNKQLKNKICLLGFFVGILIASITIYFTDNKATIVSNTALLCVSVKFFFDIMSDNKNV